MKQKKVPGKIVKRGLSLRKNKKFFGIFIGSFALIIIINATLAWSSYSEWVKNHVQSNPEEIAVSITEKFQQDSVLSFAERVEKSVKVKNISGRNAIIRVSFSESLLPFVIDMTDGEGQGNGNLKMVKSNGEALIDVSNLATWKDGSLLDSGLKDGGEALYYQATNPIIKGLPYTGESDRSNPTRPFGLTFFEWQFNPEVHGSIQLGTATPYWVFDGEYFYYSQVVEGGETTAIDLLQAVGLSEVNIPNKYKHALYDIQVIAEGVNPTTIGLKSWTSDANLLAMYKEDVLFDKQFNN